MSFSIIDDGSVWSLWTRGVVGGSHPGSGLK